LSLVAFSLFIKMHGLQKYKDHNNNQL